jgi:CRISPR-associated protein Cas2
MYIILVYDIASVNRGDKRVGKMLKHCRKYLNWIQNSVFEGEITDVKLKEMLFIARKIMDEETDSIIIFKSRDERWLDKEVIGVERMKTDIFL